MGVAILAVCAAPVTVHVYARTALARTALDHDRQLFYFYFFNKTTTSRSRDGSQQPAAAASNTQTDSTPAAILARQPQGATRNSAQQPCVALAILQYRNYRNQRDNETVFENRASRISPPRIRVRG